MKQLFLAIILTLSVCTMRAQQEDQPGWTYNLPKAGNSTYMYVMEKAGGTTQAEARNNAIARVYQSTMMRIGAVVSWDEVNGAIQQGADWATVSMKYNIPVNKVCEYTEKMPNGFLVTVLCQVAKSGNVYPEWDEFSGCYDVKTYNNGSAMLKSVFLPGLGQMGKRHVGSGIFTLLGELTMVGGAVGSSLLAQDELAAMRKSDISLGDFNTAKENYNTLRTANIAFWGAAGALYVWNLYRAYSMKPKYKKNKKSLAYYPALIPAERDAVAGVGLTLTF